MMAGNVAQIAYWNGPIGEAWARAQEKRDRDHSALTAALMALADAKPGEHVLDIGCGSGTTTLMLAERVGEKGRALGIDLSRPMLEVARRRAKESGSAAEFEQADASVYAFAPQSFNLACSQSGVMFFPDPVAAFRNIHRALKPDARLVFSCWRAHAEHPWAFVPETAAKPFLPPSPPSIPDAPGRYAFANPDRVRRILAEAGFRNLKVEKFDARVYLGATAEEAAASAIDSGPLMRTLEQADAETRRKVRAAVTERLAKEMAPDGIWLMAAAWLVSARP
jgi:ubiquinone/menaquinone biosynthesis C-methylase UbiE